MMNPNRNEDIRRRFYYSWKAQSTGESGKGYVDMTWYGELQDYGDVGCWSPDACWVDIGGLTGMDAIRAAFVRKLQRLAKHNPIKYDCMLDCVLDCDMSQFKIIP